MNKLYLIFALIAVSNMQALNEQMHVLTKKNINIFSRPAFLSQPDGIKLVTITNNSSESVIFDPKKISAYLVEKNPLLERAWKESRYINAIGSFLSLISAVGLPYLYWQLDQSVDRQAKYAKEFADLSRIANKHKQYKSLLQEIDKVQAMLQDGAHQQDKEFLELAKHELSELEQKRQALKSGLEEILLEERD